MKKIILLFFFPLFLSTKVISQAGSLDLSFGNNGYVLSPVHSDFINSTNYRAIGIQKDGKVVVAGNTYDALLGGVFLISRYNTDGSLDNEFGNGGFVTTGGPIIGTELWANAIAIQDDGKIVVGGSVFYIDNFHNLSFVLARYNIDGTLDPSFGEDGLAVTVPPSSFWSDVNSIRIQPDGKIVIGGHIRTNDDESGPYRFGLARYNQDGSLDNGFGEDGIVITSFNQPNAFLSGIHLLGNGKILAVGHIYDILSIALARYNSDGSLDQSFDDDGLFIGENNLFVNASALQKDGKILVVGARRNSDLTNDYFLGRLNANGSLDNSFDGDGLVFPNLGYSYESFYSVGIQPDGKIVIGGMAGRFENSTPDIALARYHSDGSLDENFDGDGQVVTDFGGVDYCWGITIDNGRIYFAGARGTFSPEIGYGLLAAYNTGPYSLCNQSSLVATIADAYAVSPGGAANTIYLGYGPSSLTLNAQVTGGNPNYTYSWSTGEAGQTITVSPNTIGAHTYTVTVTDATGCTSSSTKTIQVVDIRTPGKPGKVNICHRDLKGKWTTLSVLAGSVPEHLAHGDYLGSCIVASSSEILTSAAKESPANKAIREGFKLYPNPANDFIDVQWTTKNISQTSIRILNAEGKTVKTFTTQGAVNHQRISLNGLAKGVYMLVLKTGSDQQVSKFVIQ